MSFRILCGAIVCVAVFVAVDAVVAAARLASSDPDEPEFDGSCNGALQDRWYSGSSRPGTHGVPGAAVCR
ncbi:hypothetical protein [Streptomyces sp. NPDC020917]|uniref:hypothetical protein n=1 Tax=Streptomyces sp. NPDC020917 TaxID=3365102 RepID=UPI003794A66F